MIGDGLRLVPAAMGSFRQVLLHHLRRGADRRQSPGDREGHPVGKHARQVQAMHDGDNTPACVGMAPSEAHHLQLVAGAVARIV